MTFKTSRIAQAIAATALVGASFAASADFVGVYVGAGKLNYDIEGSMSNQIGSMDINQDLGYSDSDDSYKYVALEHPVPFLPNVKIQQTELQAKSSGITTQSFTFEGDIFTTGDAVASEYDFSHTDYTLYYEILDNWVNLDLGVTGREFDGDLSLANVTNATEQRLALEGLVPMVYAKAQFDFPITDYSIGAMVNIGEAGDDSINDMSVFLAYEGGSGFGAEIGYRNLTIEFDDFDGLSSDITLDGYYVGFTFHL